MNNLMQNEQNKATFSDKDPSRLVGEHASNLKTNIIEITEDKLKLILHQHSHSLNVKKGWIGPLGIFITLALTLLTADFQDALSMQASFWQAFFTICLILCLIWTIYSGYRAKNESITIDTLLKKIRNENNCLKSVTGAYKDHSSGIIFE